MEYPEGRLIDLSERDSAPTTSTSEVVSFEEPQILVDCGTETADDPGTQTASNEGPRTPANEGAQAAAGSPPGNSLEGISKWLYVLPPPHKLKIFFGRRELLEVYLNGAIPIRRNKWFNLCPCPKDMS